MTTSEQLHGQGPGDIRELLARIKNGDEEAARELLNRYESKVRLVVRRQLPRLLRPRFDSIDFLQSVWGSFFHRIQT
ncbi:MAG TPA: ECF-type sigma factor, partial [Isosphaeraceae bacterium]|nr:ECF-type sigma factor [Isosphaeraceae bacterium]